MFKKSKKKKNSVKMMSLLLLLRPLRLNRMKVRCFASIFFLV